MRHNVVLPISPLKSLVRCNIPRITESPLKNIFLFISIQPNIRFKLSTLLARSQELLPEQSSIIDEGRDEEREEVEKTYEINRSLLTGFFPFPFGVSTHICFPNDIANEARRLSEDSARLSDG